MLGSLPNLKRLVCGICRGQHCPSQKRVPPPGTPRTPVGPAAWLGLALVRTQLTRFLHLLRPSSQQQGTSGTGQAPEVGSLPISGKEKFLPGAFTGSGWMAGSDGSASGAVPFQMRRQRWCPRASRSPSGNRPQNPSVPSESAQERSCPVPTWIKYLAQHQTNWVSGHFSFGFRAVGWFLHDLPTIAPDPSARSGMAVSWNEGGMLGMNRKDFDWNPKTTEHFETSRAHSSAHTSKAPVQSVPRYGIHPSVCPGVTTAVGTGVIFCRQEKRAHDVQGGEVRSLPV